MKRLTAMTITLLLTTLVSSCGFKLRGSQALPHDINQVAVQAAPHSLMARALNKRLPVYDLQSSAATATPDANTVLISLAPESLDRRLLSVFSTGQVAEYELIYSVRYTVWFPNKEPFEHQFEVAREYQDDPDRVLAKSRELNIVLDEMRADAADRIIRLLSNQATIAYANE